MLPFKTAKKAFQRATLIISPLSLFSLTSALPTQHLTQSAYSIITARAAQSVAIHPAFFSKQPQKFGNNNPNSLHSLNMSPTALPSSPAASPALKKSKLYSSISSNGSKGVSDSSTDQSNTLSVPNLHPATVQSLVEYAVSFGAANGLQVQIAQPKSSPAKEDQEPASKKQKTTQTPAATYTSAPISLLPNSYPRQLFQYATQTLPQPFNLLVDKLSRDGPFLKETLKEVRQVDEFTGKILDLFEEIYLGERHGGSDDGGLGDWGKFARSADRLGILRSDYMLHKQLKQQQSSDGVDGSEYRLKQVELNTIASSFAGLASCVARLHSFLTERMEGDLLEFLDENARAVGSTGGDADGDTARGVPVSPAMTRLPAAMALAHKRYCDRFLSDADDVQPVVLFVVQPNETNTVDQRLLEFNLWSQHKIGVVRMSLGELYKKAVFDEACGRILIESPSGGKKREVTLVYFRAGYAPTDYPSGYNTNTSKKDVGKGALGGKNLESMEVDKSVEELNTSKVDPSLSASRAESLLAEPTRRTLNLLESEVPKEWLEDGVSENEKDDKKLTCDPSNDDAAADKKNSLDGGEDVVEITEGGEKLGIEWLARERLERSRATKCPNLGYHLAGTKKVQQELARKGVVERFFPQDGQDASIAKTIRTAFAGLYSLGADATEEDLSAVKEVLFKDGEGRYVLKPQREGGGYNYYGNNLKQKLMENCTITKNDGGEQEVQLTPALSEFILMERLFPPQQRAVLLRNGQVEGSGMTISELGCFSTILSSEDGEVLNNEYAGFLLRTKFSGVDEGGVASGFATLSSPYLC